VIRMTEMVYMATISKAVESTGLSRACIRRLIFTNKITYIKSGTKYYINMESLTKYLQKGDCSA